MPAFLTTLLGAFATWQALGSKAALGFALGVSTAFLATLAEPDDDDDDEVTP